MKKIAVLSMVILMFACNVPQVPVRKYQDREVATLIQTGAKVNVNGVSYTPADSTTEYQYNISYWDANGALHDAVCYESDLAPYNGEADRPAIQEKPKQYTIEDRRTAEKLMLMRFNETSKYLFAYKTQAKSDISVNQTYSAEGVYRIVNRIDSVFQSELLELSKDVKVQP